VFAHGNNGDKEEHWWRCGGVYGVEDFMSFSFIWDYVVMDIMRCWLNVWQGSCQARSD